MSISSYNKDYYAVGKMIENIIIFKFPFDSSIISDIKEIKGRKYNVKTSHWEVPVNINTFKGIRNLIIYYKFNFDSNTSTLIKNADIEKRELENTFLYNESLSKKTEPIALQYIDGLKLKLKQFQLAGVEYIIKNKKLIIGDEMGCIDGESMISINRAGGCRKVKLKHLYNRFNDIKVDRYKWDNNILTYASSLVNNEFRLREVTGVYYKGKKKVIQITLEDGKKLRATPDHLFLKNDNTWIPLNKIKINDILLSNGIDVCKNCGTTENLIVYKYSKFIGYCKTCMYRTLRKNKYGSEFGAEFTDNKGYIYIEGFLKFHPYNTSAGIYKHRLIYEAYANGYSYNNWLNIIKYNKFSSDHIFLTPDIIIHHKDKNPKNNDISNLECTTMSEHMTLHQDRNKIKRTIPKQLKVIDIEEVPNEIDVYDISVKESHNFIANGIIVHNCGKTIESLAATRFLNAYPALVITPNSLKYSWVNECNKWLNDKTYKLFLTDDTFTPNDLLSNHICITSYNTAIKYKDIFKKVNWKTIIIDESQLIKNSKSQRSKVIKSLAKKIDRVYLLTGTPILNRPSELIHQLNVLDKLDLFGGWSFFVERYCNASITPYGVDISGASNLDELHNKLRTYGYLRRNKKDVLKELPDKQRITVELDIDNRREYNLAAKNVLKYLSENIKKNIPEHIQTEKERREYVQQKRREVIGKAIQAESLVQLTKLRDLAAKGKLKSVIEWVEDFLESGEKLVLFGTHTEFVTQLSKHFNCNLIYGDTDPKDRQKYVDDFQTNDKTRLLILNTAIGNAGYTLTAANNMAFIELDWSPGIHLQCEDRLHRIGQLNKVNCYYLLSKGTIDLKMFNTLIEKLEIIDAVNSGTQSMVGMEHNESVLNSLIINMLNEIHE